jgi:GNAT superfamily N-acetyltransferase
MRPEYRIRAANKADFNTLVAFTRREAEEAEDSVLDVRAVERGVSAAFDDRPPAIYWVAEAPDGQVVASTSIVTEWSNFHGGNYWWIQSLFIVPEHRGQGLLELLLSHLSGAATAAGALDVRLYAHRANERALRAYRRSGFSEAPYVILQRSPNAR